MIPPKTNYARLHMMLEDLMVLYRIETTLLITRFRRATSEKQRRRILEHAKRYSVLNKIPDQLKYLDRLVHVNDDDCISNFRMDRNTFGKLCRILAGRGGLTVGKCLGVEEQVAIFMGILAHHKKNRFVHCEFWRSGATVSYYVNRVLGAVLSLHKVLLSKPTPVSADCTDHHWKWFKVSENTIPLSS